MREGGVGGVVTVRQNQFMFRTGSEFNFNTFILMNCKLSTRNQELSSKSFSRKARFQTPVRYLRQQFTFQERMLANLCGLIIAQGAHETATCKARELTLKRPQYTATHSAPL